MENDDFTAFCWEKKVYFLKTFLDHLFFPFYEEYAEFLMSAIASWSNYIFLSSPIVTTILFPSCWHGIQHNPWEQLGISKTISLPKNSMSLEEKQM